MVATREAHPAPAPREAGWDGDLSGARGGAASTPSRGAAAKGPSARPTSAQGPPAERLGNEPRAEDPSAPFPCWAASERVQASTRNGKDSENQHIVHLHVALLGAVLCFGHHGKPSRPVHGRDAPTSPAASRSEATRGKPQLSTRLPLKAVHGHRVPSTDTIEMMARKASAAMETRVVGTAAVALIPMATMIVG
jgi:hypothetical protein